MIEARGLSKRFQDKKRGEIRAVDNVSFTCQASKIYGLLALTAPAKPPRSACSLLSSSPPTAPPSSVATTSSSTPKKSAQRRLPLHRHRPLSQAHRPGIVEYFGRLNGLDEPTLKKRVDDIFNRLDMNEFRDRRCDKLSTGMMQKTSIARTLVHDPPVMIFDEPTNGLDIMTARTITAFIANAATTARPSSSPPTS